MVKMALDGIVTTMASMKTLHPHPGSSWLNLYKEA